MKKKEFKGKLSLNKEAVGKLNAHQSRQINGGFITLACTLLTMTCPSKVVCTQGENTCNQQSCTIA